MAIVAILVSVAMYRRALGRSKESVWKNNVFTICTVIDEYTYDKGRAPESMEDLLTAGYLREIPTDPVTGATPNRRVRPAEFPCALRLAVPVRN